MPAGRPKSSINELPSDWKDKVIELYNGLEKASYADLLGMHKVKDGEHWHKVWGFLSINADSEIYVAREKNKFIGYSMFWYETNDKLNKYVIGIGLLPDYLGKGIGSQLLEKILEKAKKAGIKEIVSMPKKENKGMFC